MVTYQLASVLHCSLVAGLVLTSMQQQVVAHTTAYIAVLDAWKGIDRAIDIEQFRVVGIEVWTYLRVDARRTTTLLAGILILAAHAVHIGRWTT